MKLVGLAICLGTIIGAAITVGFHLYFDILSLLFVLGGAIGFCIMKGNPENHMNNFGYGAVYFGWLGTLIGLIAITGNRFLVWGEGNLSSSLALSRSQSNADNYINSFNFGLRYRF